MELDRNTIERADFSSARRGYEPSEVEAHLREVADAVEDLRTQLEAQAERASSLSGAASERLRQILDAAEASANDIRSDAEDEARQTLREARREARSTTEEAERRASEREEEAERLARQREEESETASAEQMEQMEERTQALLRRADSLDEQFEALLERMRSAAGGAIEELRGEAEALRTELEDAAGPGRAPSTRQPAVPPADEGGADLDDTVIVEPGVGAEPSGDEALPEPRSDFDEVLDEEEEEEELVTVDQEEDLVAEDAQAPAAPQERRRARPSASGSSASTSDVEGARLIALNMALSGSPRAETADYLRETFGLDDDALLDDVYERVQAS